MPVKKFRSVAEMDPVSFCEPYTEECFARIAKLWARSSAMSPRVYPRGVFKFRSIEEAQAAREQVTAENIRRIQEERRTQG